MTRRTRRSTQLDELYRQIAAAPIGEQRLPLLGEAIMLAEEAGDDDSLYELRCSLTQSANRADDSESEVAAFSWVLDKHLADPGRFPREVNQPTYTDVAWMFKWVLNTLMKNSAIGRGQIEATLSAMEDLYRRDGLGMSAPAYLRLCAAEYLGDVELLQDLLERAEATPRDPHSDCEVCTPHWLATADLMLGEDQRAIERGQQALALGRSCLSEPQATLAELLVPLLLEGDLVTVEDYFGRCLDKVWAGVSERMTGAGELLAASAITGNVALGLDLLERRLPDLLTVVHDHRNRVGFLTGCALLLDRAVRSGLGGRPVRDFAEVVSAQSIATGTTVGDLAPAFWREAGRLASAFDARAGNQWWQTWVDKRKALASVDIPLDLGLDEQVAFLVSPSPQPSTAREWLHWADERHWLGDVEGALQGVETALGLGELEGKGLVDAMSSRAWRLAMWAQSSADVSALAELPEENRSRFDQAYGAYEHQLRAQGMADRLRIAEALGIERYDKRWDPDPDELVLLLADLRGAGVPDDELDSLEYQVAHGLFGRERGDEAVPYLLSARDHGLVEADAEVAARLHLTTAEVLFRLVDPAAHSEVDAVLSGPASNRSVRAAALRLRAYLHARAGEWQEGERDAREAAHLYLSMDAAAHAAESVGLQAALAEEAGSLSGAISATRRAIDLVERLETFDSSPLRTDLGRRLVKAGQPGQAVAVLRDLDRLLLDRNEEQGSPSSYDCAFWLGTALKDSEDPERAVDVWQAALDLAVVRGDESATVAFGRAVGTTFANYSMWDDALGAFGSAHAAAKEEGDRAQLSERIGLIRCLAGDVDGLEDIQLAIAYASGVGLALAVADWTDTRARALKALGRIDEAVAAALESSDLFAVAGERRGWAGELDYAARLLVDAGRVSDAAALLDPVLSDGDNDAELVNLRELRNQLGGSAPA